MTNSPKNTKYSLSAWGFIAFITTTYILGLFVSYYSTTHDKVYWSGYKLERLNADNVWKKDTRFNIGTSNTIQHIRFTVTIDNSEQWQRPIGLALGGPFSAEVFWNEEKIGEKGTINELGAEIAGPIDSIFFIPQRMLKPGTHRISIRLSSQHLVVNDASVFHHIWLTPYRENGRRDLRYYAVPLIILSALIGLSFQSIRVGRNAGNSLHTGLGFFGFSVVVLLLAEISRALINYSYPYHELRGIFVWAGNLSAGLTLLYLSGKVVDGKLPRIIQALTIVTLIASHFIAIKSGDVRLILDYLTLAFAPVLVFSILLFKRHYSYLSTIPIFWLTCVVASTLSFDAFLDSYQFISALILIAGAWGWTYVETKGKHPETQEKTGSTHFIIKDAGKEQIIPVEQSFALRAEGNYTAILLSDGTSVLHQDRLGVVMDTHPIGFVRVHKSYAVNLNHVTQLKSSVGSKYVMQMNNKETIPVSRYRVAEIRSLLAGFSRAKKPCSNHLDHKQKTH